MIRFTGLAPRIFLGAAASLALSCTFGAQASSDKEESWNALLGLAAQMAEIKPQVGHDPAMTELYSQLQAAYNAGRARFGGADPASTLSRTPMPAQGQTPTAGHPHVPGQRDDGGIAGTSVVPSGCSDDSVIGFNGTDVPIPALGTVTSTITIGGLAGRVWYVDSIQTIFHTFNSDLTISLTSPSGTTITLSSNNGLSNDDVFAGTYWHDNANPGGQVPYASNNGLVTDQAYVNLVAVPDLVPEESFHAFAGEDPNGDWTLTIADTVALDSGLLDAWDLLVVTTSEPSNRTTRTFAGPAFPINDVALTSASVAAAGMGGYVCDVKLRVNITHTFNNDMDITLTSPSGSVVTLTTDNGGGFDNGYAGTVWDDDASPGAGGAKLTTDATYVDLVAKNALTPEESLSTFRGEPANGTWTLRVSDDVGGDVGNVNAWAVIITTCSCGPTCLGDLNGDGQVDVNDLLGVVSTWGGCP
jgi:subtilisin-like proprotein convertase family protein